MEEEEPQLQNPKGDRAGDTGMDEEGEEGFG